MRAAILGGTGTLGTALLERLHEEHDVLCFSRGELAQSQLKKRFPGVEFQIGDVRDQRAVRQAVRGADAVFLLAAIKHIDIAEMNPLEAIKTNVLGAVAVAEEAIAARVPYVMFSNTDKAVLPISTYGYTKALAQNYLLALNREGSTRFSVFNWGNVLASRGSVIQTFVKALLADEPITVTDARMSRFWILIESAADFILDTFKGAPTDRALIPPIKGATVLRIVESLARVLLIRDYRVSFTGLRGVEKIYEVLESTHAACLRSDTCEQYTDAELDKMLRPIVCKLIAEEHPRAAQQTAAHGLQGVDRLPLREYSQTP